MTNPISKEEDANNNCKRELPEEGSSLANDQNLSPAAKKTKEEEGNPITPFEGGEIVPYSNIEGKWEVVFDVIVNGTEEDMPPEMESVGRAEGTKVFFAKDGTATLSKGGSDNHIEGSLKPVKTITTPSGRKVLTWEWGPPPDKVETDNDRIGYSDVWEMVKDDGWVVDVSAEDLDGWKTSFPLNESLFEDEASGDQAREKLPVDSFILLIHWWGMELGPEANFGVKEFLYLVRRQDQEAAFNVLNQAGAYKNLVVSF